MITFNPFTSTFDFTGSASSGVGSQTPYAETPSGTVNSSNVTFTLAHTPTNTTGVIVVLDGVVQYNGVDYTVSGSTITFSVAPTTGSTIFAYYGVLSSDTTNNLITATGNAATVPITYKVNTVTNNSAATLTITMTTTSAVGGQTSIVRIYDFSAAAQTISWVNTENSTISVPTTSNGSTTLPLTVGFQFNSATSKWRCVGSA